MWTTAMSEDGYAQYVCAPEMSTSDSDAVRAVERLQAVVAGDRLSVADVLDDLQRVAEREHLGAPDVLDAVGERLEVVSVVGERHGHRVGARVERLEHLR